MGMLVDGHWVEADSTIVDGRFIRPEGVFCEDVGGIAKRLRSQPGRYWLIASSSCPWSHRTLLVRSLKRLEHAVPVQIAGGERTQGYAVADDAEWAVPGSVSRISHLHELYRLSVPAYTGRATVPVLWDSHACRIVSNESACIVRALDAADMGSASAFTLIPPLLRDRINALNADLHVGLFNAVYRAGFAQRQDAYEEEVQSVFDALDRLERRLANARYLFGRIITETDWRLFPTLVRFDAVYHGHFKCSRRRLIDYPHLWAYARDLYSWCGVAATVDLCAIRDGYYRHDRNLNPFGIVAAAPEADWTAAHGRERLGPVQVALTTGQVVGMDPLTLQRGEADR